MITVYKTLLAFAVCLFISPNLHAQCEVPTISNVIVDQRVATIPILRVDGTTGYNVQLGDPFFRIGDTPDTTYSFGPNEQIILYGLDTATRYRVFVQRICGSDFSLYSNGWLFTTEGGERPLLDDRDAQFNYIGSASVACFYRPGSTFAATNEGDGPGACGGDPDDDVWYSFSPIFPKYTFTVDPVSGTDTAMVFEIYDERQDTLVACATGAPGESISITLENIPVSQDPQNRFEYDMRVYTAGTDGYATFELCAVGEILPVADETGCVTAGATTFDGSGAPNEFIDLLDADGEVIVSIENTQALGEVSVSYLDNTEIRLFGPNDVPYLSRNISIEVENQPEGPVRVRSYLTGASVQSFIDANHISDIDDLRVTKVPTGNCSAAYSAGGTLATYEDAGRYGGGFFVDVIVTSFSEFFFHSQNEPLGSPVSILENGAEDLSWQVAPNPVLNQVRFTPPRGLENELVSVRILNTMGQTQLVRELLPARDHLLDLGQLAPGIYFAILEAGGFQRTVRLLKR